MDDALFEALQAPVGGTGRDGDGSVFFAGEATDVDYNGFVDGGYQSGANVAAMVVKHLRAP
jgi:monoamine oxidase